jgi:hypothetical protein
MFAVLLGLNLILVLQILMLKESGNARLITLGLKLFLLFGLSSMAWLPVTEMVFYGH